MLLISFTRRPIGRQSTHILTLLPPPVFLAIIFVLSPSYLIHYFWLFVIKLPTTAFLVALVLVCVGCFSEQGSNPLNNQYFPLKIMHSSLKSISFPYLFTKNEKNKNKYVLNSYKTVISNILCICPFLNISVC